MRNNVMGVMGEDYVAFARAKGLSERRLLNRYVLRNALLPSFTGFGMALGFAYFVADNFALAMGNLGAYPPFLAAWAPFLLFLLIGEAVLLRTEE